MVLLNVNIPIKTDKLKFRGATLITKTKKNIKKPMLSQKKSFDRNRLWLVTFSV